jgi:hypothetical protein
LKFTVLKLINHAPNKEYIVRLSEAVSRFKVE